jgi:TolB-like protein
LLIDIRHNAATGCSQVLFRFTDHVLDVARRELRRDGELIAVEPQVFDLLEHLVRNRDRVVTRDDLLDAIWGGRTVSESTLASRINAARKAVGDSGEAQRLIRTVPRKGIRFVGDVTEAPSASLTLIATPRPRPSIAVLAFENLSGDPDQEYFADGLTEDILTALTRFAQLTVIARNSTFVYKGRAVSIAEIGRDLQVRYVVEGSIRRSGDRVRVTAQLIEAGTSAHLWAERYDRAMTELFSLQDEITERIVTTLVSNIDRSIIEQTRRKPPGSLDAYELFLHGREQRNASRPEGIVAAEAQFERAVVLDPGFALAHAEIAYIQYIYVTWRWNPEQRDAQLNKGFASARRALALEAPLALANRALGILHLRARAHTEAVMWTRRAVALNPGEAESYAWLANVLSYVGRSAEALEQLSHAMRLDPLHPPLWDFYIGRAMLHLGRYEEALVSFDECLRRATFFGNTRRYAAAALAQLGRVDEARAALPPPTSPGSYASIGDIRRLDSYVESIEFTRLIDGLHKAGLPL